MADETLPTSLVDGVAGVTRQARSAMEGHGAGLCAECVHARPITSAKGSTFWLCGRSAEDPRYPRYPRLPVLRCPGYERAGR